MRAFKHLFISGIAVFAVFFVLGCGGDDGSSDSATTQTTTQTTSTPTGTQTKGAGKDSGADSGGTAKSPEDRRTAADLRGQLSQGKGAGVVTGVDLGRTTITVHTRLPRTDAETASNLCAQVRTFIAQRPARSTVGRVVVAGRGGVTVTAC